MLLIISNENLLKHKIYFSIIKLNIYSRIIRKFQKVEGH